MRPKDAASGSFDWFNCDLKEQDAMTTSPTATSGEQTLYAALELSKNSGVLARFLFHRVGGFTPHTFPDPLAGKN